MEKLDAQLVSLVGENGAEMLISAVTSRRSVSGPELAGGTFIIRSTWSANPINV